MSILVADSGGSTTSWIWQKKDGSIGELTTAGLHPLHIDQNERLLVLKQVMHALQGTSIQQLHFYGAGLVTDSDSKPLRDFFQAEGVPECWFYSDLLGAARATLGTRKGMVAILGTGTHVARFDGREMEQHIPPLGFALGDEGSGADLGRRFIKGYFYGQFPSALNLLIEEQFALSRSEVLNAVYQEPGPNRYLASYVPFLKKHQEEEPINRLITDAFQELIHTQFLPLKTDVKTVGLVGGVATHFQDILIPLLAEHGFDVESVLHNPVYALFQYHQTNPT
ncbi:MAG: hypothetical protein AAFW89_02520 [Bacteroidota bacterium]